ncbi:N-acetylmannosamine kinase [Listeria monocytogenes]|nr:N-acetylmannosamine kinase [Listeria monocytogenes]
MQLAHGLCESENRTYHNGGAIRRFDNFNLKEWLEAETGLPVAIEMTPIAPCSLKNGLVKDKIWMIFFVNDRNWIVAAFFPM